MPFQNKEEFIVIVVLVPMIFTLHDPNSYHAIVYFRQRLIEPWVCALSDNGRQINQLKMLELDIKISHIRIFLRHKELLSLMGVLFRTDFS